MSSADQAVWVHWYGKKEARQGRKMGHVTCVGIEPEQSRKRIDETLSRLVAQEGE